MEGLTPRISLGTKICHAIGLMSGTSADGIDAALVQIQENPLKVFLKAFFVFPYSKALKSRILKACSPETSLLEVGGLNMVLGKAFADAAVKLLRKAKFSARKVDFIGSHGQTIYHFPPSQAGSKGTSFTVQIGDGSVIAAKTGISTVTDFRVADMAEGGEGAPLVPYVDWRLFSHPRKNRVLLNIGGISNFTYLPAKGKLEEIAASDTGPGNALLDALMALLTNGRESCDRQGRLAARGKINLFLFGELLEDPFIRKPLPKSADRELFGKPLARKILQKYPDLSPADLLATATLFTAETVLRHLWKYAPKADELVVSGGGVKNLTLLKLLREGIERKFRRTVPLILCDDLGIAAKAKEALAFAFLAHETLKGRVSNVPNVTGAHKACLLGKISLGWNKQWRIL